MPILSQEVLYQRHEQIVANLALKYPTEQFVAGFILRCESDVANRIAEIELAPPEVPEIVDVPSGLSLLRVYIPEGSDTQVDMTRTTSRPFSVVWSDTQQSRDIREQIKANPVRWAIF